MSRAPAPGGSKDEGVLSEEVEAYVNVVFECLPATEGRLEEIRKHQEEDQVLQQIVKYCQSGWPEQYDMPESLKPYFSVAAELTVKKGLRMRGSLVVIPASLHASILSKLHDGHQGVTKCQERAKYSVWWPGLSKRLEDTMNSCQECLRKTK